jgi:predicted type IV restriction endonuclease
MLSITRRISEGLKRVQPIIRDAKADDAAEADTIKVVAYCLFEIFGHRTNPEVTPNRFVSGAFIDTSISAFNLPFLLETKAIGLNLNDEHLKQAVSRAYKKSLEWLVLTNGQTWKVYKVIFSKPIDQFLITEIDLLTINPEAVEESKGLFMLCREFWQKPADVEIISDDTIPF